jgi:uncharacterized protein with NRDE domain
MCLVAISIDQHRRFPLVVASNRDEYFSRPAARLAWWSARPGDPPVLGGRDLESGGTWMGLTAQGRLGLVTNVRDGRPIDPAAPSRGLIVTDWLSARESTGSFWMRTALSGYNDFNLIAADFQRGECFWGTRDEAPRALGRGVHGLSNGGLDAPWPKVTMLKARMAAAVATTTSADALASQLFAALADRTLAPDIALPRTGIPIDRERQLSSAFIATPDLSYGTRCSTLVISEKVGRNLVTHVYERSFSATGSIALLRHSMLRNWPPRYGDSAGPGDADLAEVSESESSDGLHAATKAAAAPRQRVRSLLKPHHPRKRSRPVQTVVA